MVLDSAESILALAYARNVVRGELCKQPVTGPADPPLPAVHSGCFVSLHERRTHRLRGCIGTLDAAGPLTDAILGAAKGVLQDPRFRSEPVLIGEIGQLEIELSLTGPAVPLAGIDELDLEDGIILHIGGRRGCFLPQVAAESGWSRRVLLQKLCTDKMQLPVDGWKRPDARLESFSVQVLGPEPL